MAGRSVHTRKTSQENQVPTKTPERRRSLSQGDTTPRAGLLQGAHGATNNAHDTAVTADVPAKILSFLPDKLLPSAAVATAAAQRASPVPPQSITRTHSRAESAVAREPIASPSPGMATQGQPSKGHTSPSKASSARTYDSKLVSREMHRLGNLAHLPALAPSLSATQSTVSLSMVPPTAGTAVGASADNPWTSLHVYVLPLFNGEPLRVPIEDLNQLVKRHIQTVVSLSPSKALASLEHDASELIASGMVTLNAKLTGIEDEKLVGRIVELWGFFWDQVLPYVEGALLPLQTDSLLSTLYRTPKAHKPNSPGTSQAGKNTHSSTSQIDVRTVALHAFRDGIILPASSRLHTRLTLPREDTPESPVASQPRLQQMLLVLVSQRSRRPVSFSLTAPPPQPTAGEAAVEQLLRTVRAPHTVGQRPLARQHGAPSFLSAGLPRDRRGRIAQKHERGGSKGIAEEPEGEGEETPRLGGAVVGFAEREREKEFLESLRSPDPESTTRASMGGWGLGGGYEERRTEEEDEDMDWDQAQVVVERMVGMNLEARRRPAL
ncbi:HbrB-like-domain-containing protein [Amylocystis lapponica]|nr:HbrB-like-domain-containing protein [Amylocystis lapponica]